MRARIIITKTQMELFPIEHLFAITDEYHDRLAILLDAVDITFLTGATEFAFASNSPKMLFLPGIKEPPRLERSPSTGFYWEKLNYMLDIALIFFSESFVQKITPVREDIILLKKTIRRELMQASYSWLFPRLSFGTETPFKLSASFKNLARLKKEICFYRFNDFAFRLEIHCSARQIQSKFWKRDLLKALCLTALDEKFVDFILEA